MQRDPAAYSLVIGLMTLLGAGAGWFARANPLDPAQPTAERKPIAAEPRGDVQAVDLDPLTRQLARIKSLVASASPGGREAVPQEGAAPQATELAELIQQFKDTLTEVQATLARADSTLGAVPGDQLFDRPARLTRATIDQLISARPKELHDSFLLTTSSEVWARLGRPGRVTMNGEFMLWEYFSGDRVFGVQILNDRVVDAFN